MKLGPILHDSQAMEAAEVVLEGRVGPGHLGVANLTRQQVLRRHQLPVLLASIQALFLYAHFCCLFPYNHTLIYPEILGRCDVPHLLSTCPCLPCHLGL